MTNASFSLEQINPLAIEVCRTLQNAGYQSYIVGGCVRDLILGLIPKDWDICTDAKPEQVIELFTKTIPTGLQHGTITVSMGEGVENHFEVTTFRVEGQYLDGRRPEEVSFVNSVEEDLARRDLTINAIAYDPISNRLVDPYGGVNDLKSGIIKAVGDPNLRFQEDGLRIMRVARFAARFEYQVEENTIQGMKNNLATLGKVSKERIKDELCKTLMAKNPNIGLRLLAKTKILKIVSPLINFHPAIYAGRELMNKNEVHTRDIEFPWFGELETRLALLYLDCVPPEKIEQELISLKFATKQIKRVMLLNELYWQYKNIRFKHDELIYKKFISLIKNNSIDEWQYTLKQFINLIQPLGLRIEEWLKQYDRIVVFSRKEMQINGDDLLALGVKPGPMIKTILDTCYLQILHYPDWNTKEALLDVAANEYDALTSK